MNREYIGSMLSDVAVLYDLRELSNIIGEDRTCSNGLEQARHLFAIEHAIATGARIAALPHLSRQALLNTLWDTSAEMASFPEGDGVNHTILIRP